VPVFHHVGVQTDDLANSLAWYQDFFGGRVSWTLDTFSELTLSRLPGIERLVEIVVGDLRIHLFQRRSATAGTPCESAAQFQHVCLATSSAEELREWRAHWTALYAGGRYRFALPDQPTAVVTDPDGSQSFYACDVNGLEFEFTYLPGAAR
jgi:catechol 2,3-dioxygenase-like lactoylglutathione lyase family enzyme